MAQPTAYTPATDFSNDEALNVAGRSTVRTAQLDAELAAIEVTLDETLVNLALNQRDDGEIRDGRVKLHTLAADTLQLLATAGSTPRGQWLTATDYDATDVVLEAGATYICVVDHTSGTFATDLAAVKWIQLNPGNAAGLPFTPAAGISAGNTQAAIEEAVADMTALMAERYILLQDQKADGTQGGASSAATHHTRVLNTEVTDTHGLCSLAANQFTLAAGTYRIAASAPCLAGDAHRAYLYNATGAAVLLLGTCEYSGAATETIQTRSLVCGRFTVAAAQALELRHHITTARATNGLGATAGDTSTVEIYAQVELWKVG